MRQQDHWTENGNDASNESSTESKFNKNIHLLERIFQHRSIFLVLLGAFLSAWESILVRYIHEDVRALQISFIRFFLQLSIPIPVMTYQNISPKPESKRVFILLLFRGVFGMIALTTEYASYYYITVGDSTVIVFGSTVFTGIFARVMLKETFSVPDAFLVFIAIVGVFLICQPPFLLGRGTDVVEETSYDKQYIGTLLAFCTCVCLSFTTVLSRKMGTLGVNSFKVVLYYAFIACIGTCLLTTVIGVWTIPPCGFVRFVLVAMGILNCVTQCLITYSLSIEGSVFVSIIRTNEIIFVFILEYICFHDFPGSSSLLGVFLVTSASMMASARKIWLETEETEERCYIRQRAH